MLPLIIVTGPTTSKKSETAIELAEKINSEIISADSMQVYKYFDIGTAKVTPEDRSRVPHHLVDILEPDQEFSAFDFKTRALDHTRELLNQGKVPIITGGSGLYIKALCEGYDCAVPINPQIKKQVQSDILTKGLTKMHMELQQIDPDSAKRIPPLDIQRIERATSVYRQTGIAFSKYKNANSKRWKVLSRIIKPDTWVWMMTGTPAAQSPVDAFGLAKLVNPNRVPRYFGAWRDKVMIKMSQFVWSPHPNATTLVGEALQPAIRFTKEACLDLPELTYQTREVELTPQQIKYYKEIKSQQLTMAAGELITAVHAAAGLTKLLQISCGAVYSDSGKVVEFDASSRLTEMVSAIREASHKTIVFVPFRHAIEIVSAKLKAEGISSEVINGAVSAGKRATIFNRFQKETDPHVLVIQPQSAAHGVTLTAANTIIWFGPIASVETWLQANERINRPSQLNKMTVIKLTGSPVEKKVYRALEAKELAHKQLTSLYEDELNDN